MCMFNTGCPGWESYQSSDGFFPCTEESGCATQYANSLEYIITHEMPIETKKNGQYERFAISNEDSIWVCAYCGELHVDPDEDDHDCAALGEPE